MILGKSFRFSHLTLNLSPLSSKTIQRALSTNHSSHVPLMPLCSGLSCNPLMLTRFPRANICAEDVAQGEARGGGAKETGLLGVNQVKDSARPSSNIIAYKFW